jgi:tetratricopeptide (TPR) repeat protein
MNLGDLRAIVRRGGVEPTPMELADALWLAAQMAGPPVDRAPPAPADEPAHHPPAPPTAPAASPAPPPEPPPVELPGEPPPVELHPYRPPAGAAREARIEEVPKPIALDDRLAFQRALHPLLRRVAAPGLGTLDEEATARRAAEQPVGAPWPAVMRPSQRLWLDAVVVVDGGDSMAIWQELATDIIAVLRESGVFRQVSRHRLEGGPGSARVTDWQGRPVPPRRLVDPVNRRVVLVVSDCVGPVWRSGAAGAVLHEWARRGPVAVLQPLPERLWGRTGARTVAGTLSATRPCSPNRDLVFAAFGGRSTPEVGTMVPVLEIASSWLGRWAALIAGGPSIAAAVTWVAGEPGETAPLAPTPPPTPEQRVRNFRAAASTEAFQLARYVSLGEPVLDVIRYVHHAMFRPAKPAHLAEVLLSGLLKVEDGRHGRYRFVDGVPEVLLSTLTVSETIHANHLLERVSATVRRQIAADRSRFPALTPGAGDEHLSAGSLPFAITPLGLHRVELARSRLRRPARPDRSDAEPPAAEPPLAPPPGLEPARHLPADLFDPARAVMTFRHRDADLAALRDWCLRPGPSSVLLLTGPAGAGKTRLALELGRVLEGVGWQVVDAGAPIPPSGGGAPIPPAGGGARIPPAGDGAPIPPGGDGASSRPGGAGGPVSPGAGVLVLADQADLHPERVLATPLTAGDRPVRLLVTARAAGEWWQDVRAALPVAHTHELVRFGRTDQHPAITRAMVAELGAALFPDGSPAIERALSRVPAWPGRDQETPLELGLIACQLLVGRSAGGLLDALVERERRVAERSAVRAAITFAAADQLDGYVAAAQLFGAGSITEAREAVRLIGAGGPVPVDTETARRIALWLHQLYPGGNGPYWSQLPFAMRERLAVPAALRDPALVAALSSVSVRQAVRALEVLVRAFPDHPELTGPVWRAAVRAPALVAPLLSLANRSAGITAELLELARATMAAPDTPVAVLRAVADGVAEASLLFAGQGSDTAQALTASFERLAAASAPHRSALADAVHERGLTREREGRPELALHDAEEELELRRRLGSAARADDPATVALARALTTYAIRLGRAGRPLHGLSAVNEALQRLAGSSDPDAAEVVAYARAEQARLLGRLDRTEEAADAAREATAAFRQLVAAKPRRHDAGLAGALLIEAAQARARGQREVAVRCGAEAVERYETLGPPARLAYACCAYGMDLAGFGLYAAGMAQLDRAVTVYRELATDDDGHLPGLAAAHLGRGVLLADLEQHEAAGQAFDEAAAIYRRLSPGDAPGPFAAALAGAMALRAEADASRGRLDEAATTLTAACELRDMLHAADPLNGPLRRDLAAGYRSLSRLHERRGDTETARRAALRARLLTADAE